MAKQSSKKIKATEIASLVLSGMDDAQLMARYNISGKKLNSIYNKLIEAGFLEPTDLKDHNWTPPSDLTGDMETHALSYNPEETDTIEKTLREKEQTETILESVFQKMLEEGIVDGRKVADLKKSTRGPKSKNSGTVILSSPSSGEGESTDVPTEELLDTSFGETSQATNKDFLATADIESLVKGGTTTTSKVTKVNESSSNEADEPYEPTIELARRKKNDDPSSSDEFLTTTELENIVKAPWSDDKREKEQKAGREDPESKQPAASENNEPSSKKDQEAESEPGSTPQPPRKPERPPKPPKTKRPDPSKNIKTRGKDSGPKNPKKGKGLFKAPELGRNSKIAIYAGLGVIAILALGLGAHKMGLLSAASGLLSSGYDSTVGSLTGPAQPYRPPSNGGRVKPAAGPANTTQRPGPAKNTNKRPRNANSELLAAVKKGDPIEVEKALQRGAKTNIRNKQGLTPLMIASQSNYPAIVSALLEKKADPNLTAKDGATALMMAADEGFSEIVNKLLGHGAITDLRRQDRATALDLASIKGHTQTALALVDANANINARFKGKTPLILALENGHVETALLLVDRGANINAKDEDGVTPALVAADKGLSQVVERICSYRPEIDQPNEAGVTPLMAAAEAGDTPSVEALINNGAKVNSTDENNNTPLMYALKAPDPATVKTLLEKGASVDVKNSSGFTPLMLAADTGNAEAVKALMEKGADLSIKKEDSDLTALNMAMKKGHTDVINILFGQDSGMGAQAADLEKYLILAAESGDAKVAQTLLEKGADLNARAEEGEFKGLTALHIAATKGHLDLVKALTEHAAQTDPLGPDRKTPFLMAFEKGNKEVMELLATSGANINAKGELDNPALITATRNQDPEMVRFLLEKGADPNAEGAFFKTALDYAVKLGNLELARLLIDSGANINRKARSDGKTPLMVAAENGNEQMVELLLERGADKAIQDNIGYTAKKYALMNGHLNVVKLLSGNSQAASADSDTKQPSAPMSDMSLSR